MNRDHERSQKRLKVQFRSASALLMAYSVNLSRGGMFLEAGEGPMPQEGTQLQLEITLPNRTIISMQAEVAWHRVVADADGPRGFGLQFDETCPDFANIGSVIDAMVVDYSGISVVVLCADKEDRRTIARKLKAAISTVHMAFVDNYQTASHLIGTDTDLVVVDTDEDQTAALQTLLLARDTFSIPTIALSESGLSNLSSPSNDDADEVLGNPPSSTELRRTVLHLLSRAVSI